jgi:hypothetical protein
MQTSYRQLLFAHHHRSLSLSITVALKKNSFQLCGLDLFCINKPQIGQPFSQSKAAIVANKLNHPHFCSQYQFYCAIEKTKFMTWRVNYHLRLGNTMDDGVWRFHHNICTFTFIYRRRYESGGKYSLLGHEGQFGQLFEKIKMVI